MDNVDSISCFRVLSVQSHVVSGYVGNKSACFPLQVLGFEVDFINSVQLSNHTGLLKSSVKGNVHVDDFVNKLYSKFLVRYKHIRGQRLNAEDLQELYEGLNLNNLTSYTHILTGYVGTVTFLNELTTIIRDQKERNPSVYYVCDPVMGDNNQMYVPEDLLPVYRDSLIPLANLITPNQYEAELLTGIVIKSKEDVLEAMNILHRKGVETVVISSVQLQSSDKLQLYGSTTKDGEKSVIFMEIPTLPAAFTGTGDLFSALLLAWMTKTEGNLKISCEKTINTMLSVLKRTLNYAMGTKNPTSAYSLELKLVQSKKDIENPSDDLKCEIL